MDQPLLPLLLVPDTLASAPLRGALLMGFVLALFGAAIAAVKIGQRKRATQAASDLSALTGTGDGAHRGGDVSVSSDWWNAAVSDDEEVAPSQTWQSAFLDDAAPATAIVGAPGYAKTLDVPASAVTPVVEVAPLAAEPVRFVPAPVVESVETPADSDTDTTPEAVDTIAWSDTETEVEVGQWSTPLAEMASFDEPSSAPTDAPVVDDEVATEPAPVAAGVSEPVRTDITYVPDPQAPAAPYAYSAPAVALVAAAAIYDEPLPAIAAPAPVEHAPEVVPTDIEVSEPSVVDVLPGVEPQPVYAPEPVFDAPVFAPAPADQVVFGAPISLSPATPASADNSWGADETGDDDGISPTWWQQAIADDK